MRKKQNFRVNEEALGSHGVGSGIVTFFNMNIFLKQKARPGTDKMTKQIMRDPTVISYITKALTSKEDDDFLGDTEWRDSTRSDVVLEPKLCHLDAPPVIIEIQQSKNGDFMKRANGYCLQAYKRYNKEPIILFFRTNSYDNYIATRLLPSDIPGANEIHCDTWAKKCLVISKSSLNVNYSNPLYPLVALGLFLTSQALSLYEAPCNEDPATKYLYSFALNTQENSEDNVALSLINLQRREYERLLALANSSSSSSLAEAIKETRVT